MYFWMPQLEDFELCSSKKMTLHREPVQNLLSFCMEESDILNKSLNYHWNHCLPDSKNTILWENQSNRGILWSIVPHIWQARYLASYLAQTHFMQCTIMWDLWFIIGFTSGTLRRPILLSNHPIFSIGSNCRKPSDISILSILEESSMKMGLSTTQGYC